MYGFFSKMGYKKRQCEWLPLFIVRLCLGIFFILSGFFKIFDSVQHETLFKTLTNAGIPLAAFNSYFIPIIEILAGACVLLGLLTSLASLILFILMVIALITDRIASITAHGGIKLLENFLYLPEVLYALMFLWLFFAGPGKFSLDFAYGKKKRLSSF